MTIATQPRNLDAQLQVSPSKGLPSPSRQPYATNPHSPGQQPHIHGANPHSPVLSMGSELPDAGGDEVWTFCFASVCVCARVSGSIYMRACECERNVHFCASVCVSVRLCAFVCVCVRLCGGLGLAYVVCEKSGSPSSFSIASLSA